MLLNITHLKRLRDRMHSYHMVRHEIIHDADEALHHAKRAIFALHRDNQAEAKEKLAAAEKILQGVQKRAERLPRIKDEGSYRAAIEEYTEAQLFFWFVRGLPLGPIKALALEDEWYLAGLCDVPGELYRYALSAATAKNRETVSRCVETAEMIIGQLIEFNLTSYLRTKFDQAKQAVHKLEIVAYEMSLRE